MQNLPFSEKRGALISVSILILGTILRLFKLGYQSLWFDEIDSAILAGKNLYALISLEDTTPPFIHLVNHFWQKLGSSDFMLRFPAAVFGIISIYAAYKLANILFGKKEALFTALLISVSLYHIIYSQQGARPYTAFVILSLFSFYCLYQLININVFKRKYWVGFVIFNILNLYTHSFSVFVISEEILIWLIFIFWNIFKEGESKLPTTKLIVNFSLAIIAIFILSLPVLKQIIFTTSKAILMGGRVAFNPIYYKNLLCRYGAGNGLPLFVYNFFFISGILSLFRGDKKKEIGLLIFCMIFPFLILSFMELKHFFHIRYVIFTYPMYIIIVSKGITNILSFRPQYYNRLIYALIIIFLILSVTPLKLYYQMPARLADWKGAAEYIYKNAGDGAKVITQEWQDNLIKYYLAKKDKPKKIEVMPHHNNIYYFADILSNNYNQELYYVGYGGDDIGYGSDDFCMLAEKYFRHKMELYSPVYSELVKRELIDGDGNSWVDVGVRGYRLVVYSNKDKLLN